MLNNVNKIRNSVNTFDDAEFVSLVSENSVLIRNEKNNAEWVLNYTEDNGIIKFDGSTAKQTRDADKNDKELFEANVADLKETMKAVFSENHEEAVKALKEKIYTLPFYEDKADVAAEATEDVLIGEGKLDAVATIFERFNGKVKAGDEMFNEFLQFGYLFDEDGNVKPDNEIIDPALLLEAYEQKQARRGVVDTSIEESASFEDLVKERYDNDDVVKTILETVEPHSDKTGVQITKAIVTAKTKFDNELVLAEERKFLTESYVAAFPKKEAAEENSEEVITETFAGHTVDNIYNTLNAYPKFKFLKFRTNIYERADVDALAKEFENVIAQSYHSLDSDEFQFVNELYSRVMYMTKTNQIDDELVTETIKSFNKRFKGDYKTDFTDPDKALGWKSASQQGEQNAGGEHNPMGVEGI